MKAPAIELKSVTKKYGLSRGVENIDLVVEQGKVFGFIGPNGAGKTTTIRMILDFIRPSDGTITVLGLDSKKDAVAIHQRVGYLSGDMAMDTRLTGRQYLEYTANLRGGVPWSNIQKLIDRLQCETDRKIGLLSRGNKQKVALVAALMHQPDLLILDEPTSGLDPIIQAEFGKLIDEHTKQGKTTFISSHVLSEVQQLCDHVGFVREGRLVDVQPLKSMMSKAFKKVTVTLPKPKASLLTGIKGVSDIKIHGNQITCKITDNYTGLLKALSAVKVQNITIEEADLDDIFMHYYRDSNEEQS